MYIMYVYIYIGIYIYKYIYCVCIFTLYMYIYSENIHTYIYTYIHTQAVIYTYTERERERAKECMCVCEWETEKGSVCECVLKWPKLDVDHLGALARSTCSRGPAGEHVDSNIRKRRRAGEEVESKDRSVLLQECSPSGEHRGSSRLFKAFRSKHTTARTSLTGAHTLTGGLEEQIGHHGERRCLKQGRCHEHEVCEKHSHSTLLFLDAEVKNVTKHMHNLHNSKNTYRTQLFGRRRKIFAAFQPVPAAWTERERLFHSRRLENTPSETGREAQPPSGIKAKTLSFTHTYIYTFMYIYILV